MNKLLAVTGSAALLAGSSLLLAAPAHAAPEITRSSCEAQGGTFSRDKGVKSCTTTTNVAVVTSFTDSGGRECLNDPPQTCKIYTGTSSVDTPSQQAVTQTQKGNGEVTTTVGIPVPTGEDATYTPSSCTSQTYDRDDPDLPIGGPVAEPFEECVARALFN
jgi:hypothetical protein